MPKITKVYKETVGDQFHVAGECIKGNKDKSNYKKSVGATFDVVSTFRREGPDTTGELCPGHYELRPVITGDHIEGQVETVKKVFGIVTERQVYPIHHKTGYCVVEHKFDWEDNNPN